MKFTLVLPYALMMLSGVLAVTVPHASRAKDKISITLRPAPPPSNTTIEPISSKPALKIPIQSNYKITELECIQPPSTGPADDGDCNSIWTLLFTENLPFAIPPLFTIAFSLRSCVFQATNRDECGTVNGTFRDFNPFMEFMLFQCISNGFDSVTNGEQPPVLMNFGTATTPNYIVDETCEDADIPLQLNSFPSN